MRLAPQIKGLLAFLTGTGISVHELLKNGSLALTFAGGVLAVLGGYYTFQTSRQRRATARIEHEIKVLELKKLKRDFRNG